MKEYAVCDIKELFVLGRTTEERNPLTLFWTGSGIECNVKAAELWMEIEADYQDYEPWISIVIDGVYVSRLMLPKRKTWMCLFRGMNPEVVKNVKVLKDVQAMSDDSVHCLQIHKLKTDGIFLPIAEKSCKIEFIGDSITSGEGSIGATKEEDWIPMWFSTQNNYAVMTANALQADYHIVSQSGWGVYTGWDNNPYHNIPAYYEQVCGLLNGEKNKALGANTAYAFEKWQPDVIVVNLGTNDDAAFDSPEWRNEETGENHKQHRKEDGSYAETDIQNFQKAVVSFLEKLRCHNPNTQIVWVYGMLGVPMKPFLLQAIDDYKMQSADTRVEFLQLPETTPETIGARQHPGVLAHRNAAAVLVEEIKKYV